MLNQIEQDPAIPYLMDPNNVPGWISLFVSAFDRLWGQLSGRVNKLVPNDGSEGVAWTPYTPTFSSITGTITSATTDGRWYKLGRVVFFVAHIHITTNGTGATGISLGVPVAGGPTVQIINGRIDSNGQTVNARIAPNDTHLSMVTYQDTYPGADNSDIYVSGSYEANA